MRSLLHAVAIAILSLGCFITTSAQWSTNPNFNNAICTASNDQQSLKSVSDGAGGVIITWHDQRSGTGRDIYAQRINASGVVQWTANGVPICTVPDTHQEFPTIISDNAGGAIITWRDIRSGVNYDIYAQRINADGAAQWTPNGIAVCTAINVQQFSTITSDNAGGAIITWYDLRSGTNFDIYAQRINASGVAQWEVDGVAISTATNNQTTPMITSDNAGGAIITWQDLRNGATSDIYAQSISAGGVVQWVANGVAISAAANNQELPLIASDNAGGAVITWRDYRSGTTYDIYAQRISVGGVVQWAANGLAICTAAQNQYGHAITSDNTGGVIIAWQDFRSGDADIYAQRINAAGVVQWLADGWPICFATNPQISPTIIMDNAGGAIIVWEDFRSGTSYDIYAQRINASGSIQWAGDGVAICTAANPQYVPTISSDNDGAVVIAWEDYRGGSGIDIYAQRVDYYGYLGNAAPTITGVRDIINDQGGRVNVFWNRSHLDARPANEITNYQIWRGASGPNASTNALVLSREEFIRRLGNGESVKNVLWTANPLTMSPSTIYWEFYGYAVSHQLANYYIPMNTLADSAQQGIYRTFAMVTALSAFGYYWDSDPDSGYSVDNLPPGSPTGPTANLLSPTSAKMHWNPNIADPDVGNYRVYRGTTEHFVASPANLVAAPTDTMMTDNGLTSGVTHWYRVTTSDVHGNESAATSAFKAEQIKASVRAFLAGTYNLGTGLMNTTLNTEGHLAARFPTVGIPSRAVDSVTIEMRNTASAAGSTVRKFRPAWLLNDGRIRDFVDTTKSYVEFDTLNGNYYLVVLHRNHIPIMTSAAQSVAYTVPGAPYDFTTAQSTAWGANPMQPIGSAFGLFSGDANQSGIVTAADANSVFGQLSATGYSIRDINLSGIVTASDANMVFGNLNKASQVP